MEILFWTSCCFDWFDSTKWILKCNEYTARSNYLRTYKTIDERRIFFCLFYVCLWNEFAFELFRSFYWYIPRSTLRRSIVNANKLFGEINFSCASVFQNFVHMTSIHELGISSQMKCLLSSNKNITLFFSFSNNIQFITHCIYWSIFYLFHVVHGQLLIHLDILIE